MSEKLGPWHKLEVQWLRPIGDGEWVEYVSGPLPEDLHPDDVDFVHEFTHPAECGEGCYSCGTHQPCLIDYDLSQAGLDALTGPEPLTPGVYAARHGLEVSRGYYDTEVHSWLETDLTTSDDPRFAGLSR